MFCHPSKQMLCFIHKFINIHSSWIFFEGNGFVSKKSTRKPTNQVVFLDSPSEFREVPKRQGQGESGDSKFVMIGVWGETPWRFCFQLWKKTWTFGSFASTFFGGEVTSLRVQFQSCQLDLCQQKMEKSSWSFVIDKTCRKECWIFWYVFQTIFSGRKSCSFFGKTPVGREVQESLEENDRMLQSRCIGSAPTPAQVDVERSDFAMGFFAF